MQYKFFPLFFFCSMSVWLNAQEQLGLRIENYSGINSIFLNPANNLTTPFQWDVNLAAAGQFLDNNFGGFRNSSIGNLLNARNSEIFLATDFPSDQQFPSNSTVFDFTQAGEDKFIGIVTTITGPAFLLNFEQHGFGFFTNFRGSIGGHNIPSVLGYNDYKDIIAGEDFSIFPSSVAGMTWSELGINYLFKAKLNNGTVGFGVNIKYLQGYESFFIKNNRNLELTRMERDELTFRNGAAIEFGFTTSSLDEEAINIQSNGSGFGFDIGVTYATEDYLAGRGLKLGLSILDIGKINFDANTEYHLIDINESFFFNPRNFENVTDFREGLNLLNDELFEDTTTTFQGNTFDLALPTALTLQADVSIIENIFVNATLIQRIPARNVGVERGNLLAITPRYESRWISGFLPVSIYNWQNVKVGAAIRLAFLTLGTEDLGSFLGKKELTGTDFYAAIKLNPFQLGWKEGGGRGKGKALPCYEF